MIWTMVATVASAQSRHGLADNPNYAGYAAAVDGLGMTIQPARNDEPQIGPGTIAVINISMMEIGELVNIVAPIQPPHFLETQVVWDPVNVDLMNTTGFTLTYAGAFPGTPAGVTAELSALRDEDDDDFVETFVAGEMAIPNRTIPNNAMLGHPDLASVTPALDPHLHLYCFRLLQANVNQGWLLREERDLGLEGIRWLDHWLFRKGYNVVNAAGESVTVAVEQSNCTSIPTFVNWIKLQAPPPAVNGLDRYQPAAYSYVPLADIVP